MSSAFEWNLAADNPALYHATNLVLYLTLAAVAYLSSPDESCCTIRSPRQLNVPFDPGRMNAHA